MTQKIPNILIKEKKINTQNDQLIVFLIKEDITETRIVLIIQDKKSKNYVGVVSLSNINNKKKTCN